MLPGVTQVTVYARGLGVVRPVIHDSHASGVSSIIRFWSSGDTCIH
jgi:hypothetical protein